MSREGNYRVWRADKVKDGVDGAEHGSELEVVGLGEDEDGDPLTSCAVAAVERSPRRKLLTEAQRQGIHAYRVACEAGEGLLDADDNFIGLNLEARRAYFNKVSTGDTQNAKKKAFQRERKELAADGLVTVKDDVYRVTEPSTSIYEREYTEATRGHQRQGSES